MLEYTDPQTGENREISMEEFFAKIQNGEIHVADVQAMVTNDETGEQYTGYDFLGIAADLRSALMDMDAKLQAAENGDTNMMCEVANAYLYGSDETEADLKKAVYWLERAADMEVSIAQYNLGLFYAKGYGVERNFEKATYWMEKAAENGDEDAPALAEKFKKAVVAEKIVSSGDAQAQADLADVYMCIGNSINLNGTEDDYAIAFDYAQKAAAQDNGDGIWSLALAYEHGRGVEQDVKKTVELYRRGAELGHAPSQHSLGCYYLRGDIVEQDEKHGFELVMQSAEQGYGLGLRTVGHCYQFGNGVEDDIDLAIEWYEKALEVIDDHELAIKVEAFKHIQAMDGLEDDEDADNELEECDDISDFSAVFAAANKAEDYEEELYEQGVLPDVPKSGRNHEVKVSEYPRVQLKAKEGDERAIEILAALKMAYDDVNATEDED